MKKLLLILAIAAPIWIGATCRTGTYQTIAATETIVLNANSAYLNSVVLGQVQTNNVPVVERAFNDTQLSLKLAAVLASGGASAPVPPATKAQADSFVKLVNSQPKVTP
jgi:hypothetical protein